MKNNNPRIVVACFQSPGMKDEIPEWKEALKKTDYDNYEVITLVEEDSCAKKRNRIIDICKERGIRYVCFLDSNAYVVDPKWLTLLSQNLSRPHFCAVSSLEIKHKKDLDSYYDNRDVSILQNSANPHEISMVDHMAAFCFLMDIECGVRFDEGIPGITGMEDTVFCLDAAIAGYHVFLDGRTLVHHPYRAPSFESKARNLIWFEEQMGYFLKKYGDGFHYTQTREGYQKLVDRLRGREKTAKVPA